MSRSVQRTLIALGLLTLVASVAVAGSGPAAGLLCTVPLALVILPLLFDRGEALIDRFASPGRTARTRRSLPASAPLPARFVRRALPRGGRLIASSLAVRPPPAFSTAA